MCLQERQVREGSPETLGRQAGRVHLEITGSLGDPAVLGQQVVKHFHGVTCVRCKVFIITGRLKMLHPTKPKRKWLDFVRRLTIAINSFFWWATTKIFKGIFRFFYHIIIYI